MKLTTRTAVWGIEIKNDTVTEEIGISNTMELRDTSINFLEAVKDIVNTLDYSDEFKDSVIVHIENAINRLEDI